MLITESELLQISASKMLFPDLEISEDLEKAIRDHYKKITHRFNRTEEQKLKDKKSKDDFFSLSSQL